MKTLNRPMFRYGGPIKEGIMNGIKEPRQNYKEAGDVKKHLWIDHINLVKHLLQKV